MDAMTPAVLAADTISRTSTGEAVLFWLLGALAVIGALGVVTATKAVYSAMFLAVTMIALAVLYIAQDAPFLGVVQIVVYTGAVMMLFLFVVMLVGVDSSDALVETLRGQRAGAITASIGFAVLLIGGLGNTAVAGLDAADAGGGVADAGGGVADAGGGVADAGGNVAGLAELIFGRYVWAFELTGALLITATIGAMVLAHRERFGQRKGQRELARERFRPGGRPTPLPSPGVYARHNAVDVPARLPDGSYSGLSVSPVLRRQAMSPDGFAARATTDSAMQAPRRGSSSIEEDLR